MTHFGLLLFVKDNRFKKFQKICFYINQDNFTSIFCRNFMAYSRVCLFRDYASKCWLNLSITLEYFQRSDNHTDAVISNILLLCLTPKSFQNSGSFAIYYLSNCQNFQVFNWCQNSENISKCIPLEQG